MRNRIEVNLNQLKANLETVKSNLSKGTDIIAVVKANAYGHGDIGVSKYLEESCQIRTFAVAGLDEALRLREGGIKSDILVLSYIDPEDLALAVNNNITIALISPEHAIAMSNKAGELGVKAKAHLKINTGMNRVGFDCKTFKQLMVIAGAYKLPNLDFTGIFSHFSSSDDLSKGAEPYTQLQLERFEKVLQYLSEQGIKVGLRHISNSGAIGKYKFANFDAVRCGALMYGYNTAVDAKMNVKPVMQWKAAISTVRTVGFGDAISYSRTFVAKEEMKIATICIGYADGLPRSLSNKGTVLIHGVKCQCLGLVCMDQMMVDVSKVTDEIKMGDEAVIIGESRSDDGSKLLVQTADDVAAMAGTCMHDVLSSIQSRVERVYL